MIKVATALRTVLKGIKILDSEAVKLTDALGMVLAEDIYSDSDIPGFDNAAMDGYALKAADIRGVAGDNPKILEVIDNVKAGEVSKKILRNNQAIRIMTGAPLPRGADSVIMVEVTQRYGRNRVKIFKEVKAGENIRRKGEDIKKRELVVRKGTLLNCAHIGVLANLGKSRIKVTRRPKVAILATGDELVDLGQRVTRGKIRSSNTYTLFSQVIKCGGIPINLGIARDNSRQLERKIKQGLGCDIILTSGGVSVGDYDLVKDVLAKIGTNIRFWKVAMRPGKPLVFGTISAKKHGGSAKNCGGKGIPVFGLPGNPVSSMVSFEVFVRPAILRTLGQKDDGRRQVQAVIEENIEKKKGFTYFLRAQTQWEDLRYLTRTTGPQGSGILKSMAIANSLIIIPEDVEKIEKGENVTAKFLD